MADLVVCVVRDVLRHVPVEILEGRDVGGVSGVRIVVVVHLSAELVVLLPQISLDKFDGRRKSEQCGVTPGEPPVLLGEQLAGRQYSRARHADSPQE